MEKNHYHISPDFKLKKSTITDKKRVYPETKKLMTDIGFYLITPLLIAIPIGLYLDNKFHTRNIFTLTLIFFGFVSSIYNLIRLAKK